MPRLGGTARPGKRPSAGPGGGRFSTRARVAAGAAALAVLAVLAAAALAGSGHPTPARAPSGTGGPAGASRAAQAAPPGARTSSAGAANPNPSAHPITGPTPPPMDPALTLGGQTSPVTIVEFGDYQCTSCGAFARDTEPALIRKYVDTGVVRLVWRDFPWVDAQSVRAAVAARAELWVPPPGGFTSRAAPAPPPR
jgi:protein-disulfide isomerase